MSVYYNLTNENIANRLNALPSNYWFPNQKGDYTDWALKCQPDTSGLNTIQIALRATAIAFFMVYGLYLWSRFPDPTVEDVRMKRFAICSSLNAWIMMFTGLFNIIQISQADDVFLDNCFRVDVAKYVQWSITCPLLTIQIAILGNSSPQRMIETFLSTLFMLLLGVTASIAPEISIRLPLFFASFWFFMLLWVSYSNIIKEATRDRETLFRGSSYIRKVALFVLVSWTLFPVRLKWGSQMLKGELEDWEKADEATRIALLIQRINAGDTGFMASLSPDQLGAVVKDPDSFEKMMGQLENERKTQDDDDKEKAKFVRNKGRMATQQFLSAAFKGGGLAALATAPQQGPTPAEIQMQKPPSPQQQQQMPPMPPRDQQQMPYGGQPSFQGAPSHQTMQMTPMGATSQMPMQSMGATTPFGMPQAPQPSMGASIGGYGQPQQGYGNQVAPVPQSFSSGNLMQQQQPQQQYGGGGMMPTQTQTDTGAVDSQIAALQKQLSELRQQQGGSRVGFSEQQGGVSMPPSPRSGVSENVDNLMGGMTYDQQQMMMGQFGSRQY
uniref:Uncharacterized protein n=1 Tax=Chromera velia CCMP2878 TaxID=1169474 RepID=A0A0G4HDN2_9ALVE|eukprot:Cvel_26554.t1-p1 / transcript=Cvel_26554.t1 / gene=Cvel_26554 / organism=Chromera_velia_CCMP2878 / gene_product=hypothetical protein / transcript_product=hypothetical protein / location=Cvel_scaffold3178:9746-17086(-) / protein_length=553 / sequence_SO=supercontig / SO=protein_coding / is_pseudo=false